MTALVVLTAVFAYLVGYFMLGWHLARRDLPNAWGRARIEWSSDPYIKGSVQAQTICMALFWAILIPVRAMRAKLGAAVDAGDPRERERDLARREREIARLERELGIRS
jgi:hypothetical protein